MATRLDLAGNIKPDYVQFKSFKNMRFEENVKVNYNGAYALL